LVFDDGGAAELFWEKPSIDLGFSCRRLYIGGGVMPEGSQGPHTIGWCTQGSTRASTWCGFPWPPSDSSLDSVSCRGKIGTSGFVSSNCENISCVTFLKHKIAENRELALWHLVNRLVPENA
jgi:hypothetical protein